MIVIVNTGRVVEQRIVGTDGDLTSEGGESFVARLRSELNAEVASRPFLEASARLSALADRFEPADRDMVRAVARALDEALLEEREERVVLAGTSNLARFDPTFPLTIGPVLEALEEHVVLLKLGTLGSEAGTGLGHDAVAVRIGHENPHEGSPPPRSSPPGMRRAQRSSPASGCSDRPAWTTPRPWPRCVPWHGTSRDPRALRFDFLSDKDIR